MCFLSCGCLYWCLWCPTGNSMHKHIHIPTVNPKPWVSRLLFLAECVMINSNKLLENRNCSPQNLVFPHEFTYSRIVPRPIRTNSTKTASVAPETQNSPPENIGSAPEFTYPRIVPIPIRPQFHVNGAGGIVYPDYFILGLLVL